MTKIATPDRNLPIPPKAERGGRPHKWPYNTMAIGESFFLPRRNLSLHTWKLKSGFDFVRRNVTENGVTGTRVWRIA